MATAAYNQNEPGVQLEGKGSLIVMDRQVHLAREIPDSFSLVEIPGYPMVNIYQNNQWIGKTDANGNLFAGLPVPVGAMVILPDGRQFPVGENGFLYLSGLIHSQTLTALWGGSSCQFKVDYPQTNHPQPDLGVITCQ